MVLSIISMSFSRLISLYQKLSAPAAFALSKNPTSAIDVTIMILIFGNFALISAAASMPSRLPAVQTSINIKSTGMRQQRASASPASLMLPADSYRPLSAIMRSIFSRGIL